MSEISINYREVENKISQLRNRLNQNLLPQVNQEYRQIQSNLRQIDGSTAASYSEALNENNQKILEACSVLNKMLSFIANSSKQVEKSDIAIARNFTGRR